MIAFTAALLLLLATASIGLAAVEASFYLLRRRRLSHIAESNPRADIVNRYLKDPPTLLMPVHMGTYTAHVGMTVVLTAALLPIGPHLAMLVAFAFMLGYLLIFRLSVPYALVRGNPERSLLLLLPFFDAYARALSPLVRWLRKRAEPEHADRLEGEDSGSAVPEVPPPPALDSDESRLVNSLDRFSTTSVREVMTPRPDIVAVASNASIADLLRLMRETKYSRLPVYGENLDDMVGVVTVRDLLEYDGDTSLPLKPLARPVYLVPESKKVAELIKDLQKERTTFAVVIDEYGGTAGLVTIEDIVEELVGEIKDEYDVETEPIVVEPCGTIVVSGRVSLDRLEQALETSLANGAEIETVGGFVTTVFGRIPRAGEKTEHKGLAIEVVDAERKRVNRVRVRRVPETHV